MLFCLPLLALIGFIIAYPVDKRQRYLNLNNDCFDHGLWVYDRIYNNDKPIDMVFLGSSLTLNGINDQLLSDSLKNRGINVANLGYCRLGRNLIYAILKDAFKIKKIKQIIIEVKDDEDRSSHPIFPYIADEEDVFFPYLLFNQAFLNDMYKAFMFKLQLQQAQWFGRSKQAPIRTEDYGFASSPDTADEKLLEGFRQQRASPRKFVQGLARSVYMQFPRHYLKQIKHLADKHDARITFLYFPSFGSVLKKPVEYANYLPYGNVLLPPDSMLANTAYWHDDIHLNQTGAKVLSNWLLSQF